MTPWDTFTVLVHYIYQHVKRFGKLPKKRDVDPVAANTLIKVAADVPTAILALDAWFTSTDPWYGAQGFGLEQLCGPALSRLYAQGDLEPAGGWTEESLQQRKLLISLLLKPELEVIPGKKT